MNAWWTICVYLISAALLYSSGWYVESLRWDKSILKSEEHANQEIKTQDNITQEATNDYEKSVPNIDAAYDSVQPANSLPPISKPPAGACATRSRVYRLTYQQCDLEWAKFNDLWRWAQAQAKVK